MKLTISAILIAGAAAVFYGPNSSDVAAVASSGSDTAGLLTTAEASLDFIARPSPEDGVLMPDWPVRLPMATMDEPPLESYQSAVVQLETPAFTNASPQPTRNQRRITGNKLALRSGPGKRYGAITSLKRGEYAEILGRARNGWVPIKVARTGQRGWVFHRYIEPV